MLEAPKSRSKTLLSDQGIVHWKTMHCDLPDGYILGSFKKLQKKTFSFFISVCLSTWNNVSLTGRIFMKFDIWGMFKSL